MRGFKSFPDRTRLDFAPGVSVVVGPNGSGKSNITDAIVWALGEQSPSAVRGQSMQDVIFGGGPGIASRSSAEVELVLDDDDGRTGGEFSEVSIVRRLDRSGDGEYRINGARCRLVDVLELLSDTGLGKEMHSVVSQGRVDSIVNSKPRDRRLLIEEAAGLGKHRKRRRRAELKLDRTRDNLDRALDVEREARSRLRPLKRQAEAAETHERLELQAAELRAELAADDLRAAAAELAAAEAAATKSRALRAEIEGGLAAVAEQREHAEQQLAERASMREQGARRLYAARGAADRIALRRDRAAAGVRSLEAAGERRAAQLAALAAEPAPAGDHRQRIAQLELDLEQISAAGRAQLEVELGALRKEIEVAGAEVAARDAAVDTARAALAQSEQAAEAARERRQAAQTGVEQARSELASVTAELAALNRYLESAAVDRGYRALFDRLAVEAGCEHAVAAVLGSLIRAGVAADLVEAGELLDRGGDQGGVVLLRRGGEVGGHSASGADRANASAGAGPPCPNARPLVALVTADPDVKELVASLLADVWLVESLNDVGRGFRGVAVTTGGRVWSAAIGELRQAPAGGEERALEARNRYAEATALSVAQAERVAEAERALDVALEAIRAADATVEQAAQGARVAVRARDDARDRLSGLERSYARRTGEDAVTGADAVRRAELTAELRAAVGEHERQVRELAEREKRRAALSASAARADRLLPPARSLTAVLESAAAAVGEQVTRMAESLAAEHASGDDLAVRLREQAQREADLQARLKAAADAVTTAEVSAERARDVHATVTAELAELATRLERELGAAPEPLAAERRDEAGVKLERITRRREQLGPVNPLARKEYEEALDHVEEIERRRVDLEGAIKELTKLIREIADTIRHSFEETFTATAENFSDVIGRLFPGGSGRLRLAHDVEPRPGPALLGEDVEADPEPAEREEPGVEIEVTLPGKKAARLTLLSGGEKSLVALAFVFAVFLTRPCPFYVLDEAEAALDDLNIDRFLALLREYSDRAQFIVVTHQKRTMDAADCLYGVSMGHNGVSKVVSRRLKAQPAGGSPGQEQPLETRSLEPQPAGRPTPDR